MDVGGCGSSHNHGDKDLKSDDKLAQKYGPTIGFNKMCMMSPAAEGAGYQKKKHKVGDNMHFYTRNAAHASSTRQQSSGVVFRNWHPGPLLFQSAADALGWRYSVAVLRAIDAILKVDDPKKVWDPYPPRPDVLDTPSVHNYEPKWSPDEDELPNCYNGESPTYGVPSVEWIDVDHPEYPDYLDKSIYMWQRFYAGTTGLVPSSEKKFDYCWHIDRCAGWRHRDGPKLMETDTGWLVFKLPKLKTGYVGFCLTGEKDKSLPGWEVMMNGKRVEPPNGQQWTMSVGGKCILVWKTFPDEESRNRDHHFLAMQLRAIGGARHARPDHIFGV